MGVKALIFDLDGTLVDSVYAHVLAFQIAFAEAGMVMLGAGAYRVFTNPGDLHQHLGELGLSAAD